MIAARIGVGGAPNSGAPERRVLTAARSAPGRAAARPSTSARKPASAPPARVHRHPYQLQVCSGPPICRIPTSKTSPTSAPTRPEPESPDHAVVFARFGSGAGGASGPAAPVGGTGLAGPPTGQVRRPRDRTARRALTTLEPGLTVDTSAPLAPSVARRATRSDSWLSVFRPAPITTANEETSALSSRVAAHHHLREQGAVAPAVRRGADRAARHSMSSACSASAPPRARSTTSSASSRATTTTPSTSARRASGWAGARRSGASRRARPGELGALLDGRHPTSGEALGRRSAA